MKLTEFLRAELNRQVDRSRRVLEQVPSDKYDWKPHDRSMLFGYLAQMVASIPSWIAMVVTRDDLDVAPAGGSSMDREPKKSSVELLIVLEKSAADAREALEKTTDEHLQTPWRLKARGEVVLESPRYEMIQDTITIGHITEAR